MPPQIDPSAETSPEKNDGSCRTILVGESVSLLAPSKYLELRFVSVIRTQPRTRADILSIALHVGS